MERTSTTLRAQLGSIKAEFDRAKAEVAAIEHQVGCPCTSCGRDLTADEIAPARDARRKSQADALRRFNETKAGAEKAIAANKALADSLASFRASMTDVSEKSAQRASESVLLAAIERAKTERASTAQRARDANEQHKALKGRPNPYVAEIERIQAVTKALADEMDGLMRRLVEIERELRIAELSVSVFSPAGVRAHILDTVTPFLNDQTAKYLSVLSDDNIQATWTTLIKTAKGELREKFSIEVTSRTGGERFASVSGGEKRKVRIAAALALQDLVSTRATKSIDLMVMDEIDTALDNAGLERLMMVLEEKARERGSIIVISHADLKDWIPQILTVVKRGGIAEILEEVA